MTVTVGTASDVVRTFTQEHLIAGGNPTITRTPLDNVPGGRRVHIADYPGENGYYRAIYSYRSIVAVRGAVGEYAITPRKYGPSTGKLIGRIRRAIESQGFTVDGGTVPITVAVPGRHGGFGIPWHATGWEVLPFILYT